MINQRQQVSPGRVRKENHHHRKRGSVSRLSSDTTSTLPEYTTARHALAAPIWSESLLEQSDQPPPDYPDSAEEADEETDDYVPLSPSLSPRRLRRFRSASGSRSSKTLYNGPASASDTYLDSLLERSVHALEMSNALLHSTMSTQSSLSTVLGSDLGADRRLESRARMLSSRIRNTRDVQAGWMDDLDDLAKGVENLYGEEVGRKSEDNTTSRSLPSSSQFPQRRSRRRPSSDSRSSADTPRLHMAPPDSGHAFSPPPRALTQYVSVESASGATLESGSDGSSAFLPSTPVLRRTNSHGTRSTPTSPSPAVASFASFVEQAKSSRQTSPASSRISRSLTPRAGERPSPQRRGSHSSSRSRSSSTTQKPSTPTPIQHHIATIEELTSPSDSSASSQDGPVAIRTVESLRKILDEQPMPTDAKGKSPAMRTHSRNRSFDPRSPPVAPVSSTSSTTTSISRLLTKGSHSTSTRAPSPPRQSSLKQRALTPTSPTFLIPESASSTHSRTSSGRSTPHKVAFAQLPESYITSKGGSSPKFQEKRSKSKSKSREKEKMRESAADRSWWTAWLAGGSGLTASNAKHEERIEERVARSFGRPGMGSMDEWAV